MIRLIVNADDLGLADFIDTGILRCAREGILRSASLLVRGRTARTVIDEARRAGLGIGVHLALSGGLPPAADPEKVPTLLEGATLRRSWTGFAAQLLAGRVDLDQVELELDAQVAMAQELGSVDHVDGHQHLHVFPGVLERVLRVCQRRGIHAMRLPIEPPLAGAGPARELKRSLISTVARSGQVPEWMRTPDRFHGLADGGRLGEEALLAILERLGPGTHEIGCHPGAGEGVVAADPGWRSSWALEAQALCSRRVARRVEELGIELARFADLA